MKIRHNIKLSIGLIVLIGTFFSYTQVVTVTPPPIETVSERVVTGAKTNISSETFKHQLINLLA